MSETLQHIEDRLLSPQCLEGQHHVCKHSLSYIAEDGVGRTMLCPCRCHDEAPKSRTSDEPEFLYVLQWEYEVKQETDGPCPDCKNALPAKKDCRKCNGVGSLLTTRAAWIRRRVMAIGKEAACDWIDAVEELAKVSKVRDLAVLKHSMGKAEKVI